MNSRDFHLVDVFTSRPFSGNSLSVFPEGRGLSGDQMLAITQELRHFESVFLEQRDGTTVVRARVFDLTRELDFAGHPLMGAAAVLHTLRAPAALSALWSFELPTKMVPATSRRDGDAVHVEIDQGCPEFGPALPTQEASAFARALNLDPGDLSDLAPAQVVSTGLRYLVLPLRRGLERARIVAADFEAMLADVGAEFAYVLDVEALEGRHWNNDGLVEDVATGSGAGTAAAFLAQARRVPCNAPFTLRQGRFTGRPSELTLTPVGEPAALTSIRVGGHVARVGTGTLERLPTERSAAPW
jgi:trans-2,3-dihydro-3-hydroxyanthranilate isomerase